MNNAPRPKTSAPAQPEETTASKSEDFFPRGAIAFFVSLIIGFGLIWAGLFYLMVQRQFHP